MQRYFLLNNQFFDGYALISGQDYHHIKNVMRFKMGDEVTVVDEDGHGYLGKIAEFTNQSVKIELIEALLLDSVSSKITIAQAMIKRDRFEWFLEKATELGTHAIIPTLFEYSIIKIDEDNETKKIQRYQTIVKEASEQSRRLLVPKIHNVHKLSQISYDDYDKILICYEGATKDDSLSSVAKKLTSQMNILVIIGPEGGISPKELTMLKNKGGIICSLGKRILRSETAGLLVLSYLNTLWEC